MRLILSWHPVAADIASMARSTYPPISPEDSPIFSMRRRDGFRPKFATVRISMVAPPWPSFL